MTQTEIKMVMINVGPYDKYVLKLFISEINEPFERKLGFIEVFCVDRKSKMTATAEHC